MAVEDSVALVVDALGLSEVPEPLLQEALTEHSFANESREADVTHNERLSWLGDAALELIVRQRLCSRRRGISHDEMARLKAHLVSNGNLAAAARHHMIGPALRLGNQRTDENNDGILATALEAIVGAVYASHGLRGAEEVVQKIVDFDAPVPPMPAG